MPSSSETSSHPKVSASDAALLASMPSDARPAASLVDPLESPHPPSTSSAAKPETKHQDGLRADRLDCHRATFASVGPCSSAGHGVTPHLTPALCNHPRPLAPGQRVGARAGAVRYDWRIEPDRQRAAS